MGIDVDRRRHRQSGRTGLLDKTRGQTCNHIDPNVKLQFDLDLVNDCFVSTPCIVGSLSLTTVLQ